MSPQASSIGKKVNHPESFTGIMHMEHHQVQNDEEIGSAIAADVYEALPASAEVLGGVWQDFGNILDCVNHGGKSDGDG